MNPGDPEKPPPFLDTYAERALKYAGVSKYELVSSVSVSPTEHVARYKVVMDSGEQACLTFHLAWESVIKAAYRGIATDNAWALHRVRGESMVLVVWRHVYHISMNSRKTLSASHSLCAVSIKPCSHFAG